MNSTIQQLQANLKFEKLLDLFEEIAPNNQNVQKQISLLSNSKSNYIKKLQSMWHAIQTPKFTELEIREICQGYYMSLERTNEMRLVQGLNKIAIVDPRNWVVKSESAWHGWNCETGSYFSEPLLFEGAVNYTKIFEPLTISDKQSGSINLIWTLQKFIKVGSRMGLSQENWVTVWLTLAKDHMSNDFQALSRNSDDVDALFIQLTASINSDNEIAKIRTALGQISRKPTELLQSALFKMLSFYEMLLSIEYPSMGRDEIHLRADHYAASSAHHLVSKNTALVINQFIALRNTENDPVSVIAVTNLVTSHEAATPSDKASSILYLPESCTRLDKQATQASTVSDLVLATSSLSLGKSNRGHSKDKRGYSREHSRDKQGYSRSPSREKYRGRSKDRESRKGRYYRQQGDRKQNFNADRIRRSSSDRDNKYRRSSSPGRQNNFRRSSSDKKHNPRRSISGSKDKNNRGRYKEERSKSRSSSQTRGKSPRGRNTADNTDCMRCGMKHLSIDCRLYPFYKGEPCSVCHYMHDTKMHRGNRQNSTEGRPRKSYSIPDHKYCDPPDGIYMTTLQKRDKSDENIFRTPKN
jgi:hypothetical protein